jgi:iron complex outermembrane receptor protein
MKLIRNLLLFGPISPALMAQQNNLVLEEVVVTAHKKEESLQDTPIAIDVFGEDALQREGIGNVGDLANNILSLNIQSFPSIHTTSTSPNPAQQVIP